MANTVEAKTAEYEVTERAGRRVAGRVVVKGEPLVLTEAEAEHALGEGTIVPKGKELPKVFAEGSKRLDRMRAEANAVKTRAALQADGEADDEDEAADRNPPKPPLKTPSTNPAPSAADAPKA